MKLKEGDVVRSRRAVAGEPAAVGALGTIVMTTGMRHAFGESHTTFQ
jgi:hypothetical protein